MCLFWRAALLTITIITSCVFSSLQSTHHLHRRRHHGHQQQHGYTHDDDDDEEIDDDDDEDDENDDDDDKDDDDDDASRVFEVEASSESTPMCLMALRTVDPTPPETTRRPPPNLRERPLRVFDGIEVQDLGFTIQ